MKLKLLDQRNTIRERIRHIYREYSREKSICAKCVQPGLMVEEKHELTTTPSPARRITTFSVSSFFGDHFQVSQNESETKLQGVKKPGVYIFRVKNMSYKLKQQLLPETSYLSAKPHYVKSCKKNKHVHVPKRSSGWV